MREGTFPPIPHSYTTASFAGYLRKTSVEDEPLGIPQNPPPLPGDRVRDEQARDEHLAHLRQWLIHEEEPDEGTRMLWGPAQKYMWNNRQLFHLTDGIVCKRLDDRDVLVVPRSLREEVMKSHHDLPLAGHPGRERTLARVKHRYFWYGMTPDITEYVQGCPACNINKTPNRYGRCPMTQYHAGSPMERVHLDFLGPLPKTTRGNQHILMMVDQFTKWVECIPLPSQTAEETARAAVNEFFARFGCPFEIFTDQGRNFESHLFKELCVMLEIHKARTTPFRPSANGQVERYNRTLMQAVRCYVGKTQNKWDEYLPQIAGALRSTVNSSTGYTPNRMMLGREVNQPADLLYPVPDPTPEVEVHEYLSNLRKETSRAHEVARSTLRSTQLRLKRNYDLRSYTRRYKQGDLVYILDTARIKGKCKKLSSPWKGPGVVVEKLSPYHYRVRVKAAVSVMNHDRLKACHGRKVPAWCKRKWVGGPEKVYCLCRKKDDGKLMVQCSGCEDWFHGKCVGITARQAKRLPKYFCPDCIDQENGQ